MHLSRAAGTEVGTYGTFMYYGIVVGSPLLALPCVVCVGQGN